MSKNSHVLMKEKREMAVDIGYHNKETVKIAVRGLVVGNSKTPIRLKTLYTK